MKQTNMREGVLRRNANGPLELLDGPMLPQFNSSELAGAIEHELRRAEACGFTRISLHMGLVDAAKLMQHLRR